MSTAQKVAVITGASQGIGAALVQAFRSRNYKVVATSRSIKPAADPDIATVQGDVADPKTANLVFKEVLNRFDRVDTLVNDAGMFMAKPFTAYSKEDYAAFMATNVTGFFHMTQRDPKTPDGVGPRDPGHQRTYRDRQQRLGAIDQTSDGW
jgi:NAD(P)-dependent dehydrogenase (short-subunit alcohol dehydrogenase family)